MRATVTGKSDTMSGASGVVTAVAMEQSLRDDALDPLAVKHGVGAVIDLCVVILDAHPDRKDTEDIDGATRDTLVRVKRLVALKWWYLRLHREFYATYWSSHSRGFDFSSCWDVTQLLVS